MKPTPSANGMGLKLKRRDSPEPAKERQVQTLDLKERSSA